MSLYLTKGSLFSCFKAGWRLNLHDIISGGKKQNGHSKAAEIQNAKNNVFLRMRIYSSRCCVNKIPAFSLIGSLIKSTLLCSDFLFQNKFIFLSLSSVDTIWRQHLPAFPMSFLPSLSLQHSQSFHQLFSSRLSSAQSTSPFTRLSAQISKHTGIPYRQLYYTPFSSAP